MSKQLFGIGDRIKKLRETDNMTQAELAKILGLSRSAVNAWEMGFSTPSTYYVIALAKQFHVSSDFLLGINCSSTIDVQGLSDNQVYAVTRLIDCFRDTDQKY